MTERNIQYQSLSLPKFFIEEIKEHIEKQKTKKKNPRYSSITDLVKQAVRERMDKDNQTKLEKYAIFLKELGSPEEFQRNIRQELNDIVKHGNPEEIEHIKEMEKTLKPHIDAKQQREEKWDKSIPEEKTIVQVSIGELETLIRKIISETPEKKEKKKTF